MHIPLSPTTIHPPFSPYSQWRRGAGRPKLVFCSGQLGIAKDGSIPPGGGGQAKLCFDNIEAILREAGMGLEHVVRINAYVTGREHLAAYMDVRKRGFRRPFRPRR